MVRALRYIKPAAKAHLSALGVIKWYINGLAIGLLIRMVLCWWYSECGGAWPWAEPAESR